MPAGGSVDLPRELLLEIAHYLTDEKDTICFALAYRPFRNLYAAFYWSRLLADQYFLRCRLYRDLPLIYHCRRCKCDMVPCPDHGLDSMMNGELRGLGLGTLSLFDAMDVEDPIDA
jgi:hypothetical protein